MFQKSQHEFAVAKWILLFVSQMMMCLITIFCGNDIENIFGIEFS